MMYKDHGGRWNDISCGAKMASICEFGAKAQSLCPKPPTKAPPGNELQFQIFFLIY